MAGALHYFERVVAPNREPGDARGAQVVEGDGLPRGRGLVKLGTRDAGAEEHLAEQGGEILGRGGELHVIASGGVERAQEREDGRFDREPAGSLGLGRFPVSFVIDASVDVHDAVLQVDIVAELERA